MSLHKSKLNLLILGFLFLLSSSFVHADNRPKYQMRASHTDLWDMDVDYFSPPVLLVRNSSTAVIHNVSFDVLNYKKYCSYWESRCVQYDQNGRCVSWERYCARWDYQTYRVSKTIGLNFRKAAQLSGNEEEVYELTVHRSKPFDEGEDQVSTWLREEAVLSPVKILKFNDYSYTIEKK